MTIKCGSDDCNYPDCLCTSVLLVQVFIPSRFDKIANATTKIEFRGGTPAKALKFVKIAIAALQAELDVGIANHADPPADTEGRS